MQGQYSGSGNGVYPAAARFFESFRIPERRSKSAQRLREEAAFGSYGRATKQVPQSSWVEKGDRIVWTTSVASKSK